MGTILPYVGILSDIPHGWYLCNGNNGTPDLRDRFLTCAGATYTVGNTGGENFHQLSIEEMPRHNHSTGNTLAGAPGIKTGPYSDFVNGPWVQGLNTGYTGSDRPHENRPPFYAVYYIIRMK